MKSDSNRHGICRIEAQRVVGGGGGVHRFVVLFIENDGLAASCALLSGTTEEV